MGFLQKLCTSAVMWKRLRHPNVANFLGFDSDSPFSLVYPWMPKGNLPDYLRSHPDADRLGLVCGYPGGVIIMACYPDPRPTPAIWCRPRIGLPPPIQSGPREPRSGKRNLLRPELGIDTVTA